MPPTPKAPPRAASAPIPAQNPSENPTAQNSSENSEKENVAKIRPVTTKVEMLKKIAPRLVMEEEIKAPKQATDLYTVIGVATGIKTGTTNYGPWVGLMGNFEVIRTKDGKKFLSGTAFLPEPFNGMIASAVLAGLRPDENGEVNPPAIRFVIVVTIKPSNAAIGYEYVAKPLVEVSQADQLADLRVAVAGLLPAPSPIAISGPSA